MVGLSLLILHQEKIGKRLLFPQKMNIEYCFGFIRNSLKYAIIQLTKLQRLCSEMIIKLERRDKTTT